MYKPTVLLLLFIALLVWACTGNQNHSDADTTYAPPEEDSADISQPFFPYGDYIKNQITYVDTTPVGIEKKVEINGVTTDSGFISKEVFKREAATFLEPYPEHPGLKQEYRETSFNDLSTKRITFSISTQNPELPLQTADVILNSENQQVKNVLLKKQFNHPDSSVTQYLVWVDKMHFQISETITRKNGTSYARVTRVVWDKPLE